MGKERVSFYRQETLPLHQPSRAEKGCQTWNTRNQSDSVDHNLGLNFVIHQNVCYFKVFWSQREYFISKTLQHAGAGSRLLVFNYFQRQVIFSMYSISQRRVTHKTNERRPHWLKREFKLVLCSVSASGTTLHSSPQWPRGIPFDPLK